MDGYLSCLSTLNIMYLLAIDIQYTGMLNTIYACIMFFLPSFSSILSYSFISLFNFYLVFYYQQKCKLADFTFFYTFFYTFFTPNSVEPRISKEKQKCYKNLFLSKCFNYPLPSLLLKLNLLLTQARLSS